MIGEAIYIRVSDRK